MIYLNCGNLWSIRYLDKIMELNEKFRSKGIVVNEIYGSIPQLTGSARASWRLPSPDVPVKEYVSRAKEGGIEINYTLNQSCPGSLDEFGSKIPGLKTSIYLLLEAGINRFTVTLPLMAQLLLEMDYSITIKVSTIARVESIEEASYWINLGAKEITGGLDINRNFPLVKKLVEYCKSKGVSYETLASEFCCWRCPFRYRGCYSSQSHNSSKGAMNYWPWKQCNEIRRKDPSQFIKSRMILPQHLKRYQELTGVDKFKVTTRTASEERALWILEQYLNQDYQDNIVKLWTVSHLAGEKELPFYISGKKLNNLLDIFIPLGEKCDSMSCEDCGVCQRIYEEASSKDGEQRM